MADEIKRRREEDDDMMLFVFPAMYMLCGMTNSEKIPRHISRLSGKERLQEILEGHVMDCKVAFRMEPHVFKTIANYLREEKLLKDSRGLRIEEKLGIFMFMLAHNASFQDLQYEFKHSGSTLHRHIKSIFKIIPALTYRFLKLPHADQTHWKIRTNPRFFPYFKNCIGAIDGTHIPITIDGEKAAPYRNRKGTLSQNVIVACDFDLNFTFISCGWEGSATDARVLRSAMNSGFQVPNVMMFGRLSPKASLLQQQQRHLQKKASPKSCSIQKKKVSPKAQQSRASWNPGPEKALVDLLHEHNNPHYRCQNGWTSEAWNKVVKEFRDRHPYVTMNKQQIQDKEKELKRDYRLLKEARKQSGASWDNQRCMIVADDAVWANIITSNEKVRKFSKNKSFPLFESLGELYDGQTAEGNMNFTSIEPFQHATLTQVNEYLERSDSFPDVNWVADDDETTEVQDEDNAVEHENQGSHITITSRANGEKNMRKRQSEEEEAKKREEASKVDDCSIRNCITVVESMEELSNEEKVKSFGVFKDAQNREIFMSAGPMTRLIWLRTMLV
ncbi:Os05g0217900 [Oryza sativa Japonica Group]|uniref:Os05g0217900 protein n=1 Tax=Oryza sativa subsp. japonica TaxID=39947 RepID=Q0DJX0_ORYSJ|nr:Os05g0217900 [Oryza sativa Japonica Group]|eukprot:NP_001054939.2 Os05g0217900 [Oryza sativa Japonica Group]